MAKKYQIPSHILANLRYHLSPYGTWSHGLTIKRRTGELGRYRFKTYTRNHVCSILVHMVYYGSYLDNGTRRGIKPRHFINAWTKTTAWSKATKEICRYLTNTLTQSLL